MFSPWTCRSVCCVLLLYDWPEVMPLPEKVRTFYDGYHLSACYYYRRRPRNIRVPLDDILSQSRPTCKRGMFLWWSPTEWIACSDFVVGLMTRFFVLEPITYNCCTLTQQKFHLFVVLSSILSRKPTPSGKVWGDAPSHFLSGLRDSRDCPPQVHWIDDGEPYLIFPWVSNGTFPRKNLSSTCKL